MMDITEYISDLEDLINQCRLKTANDLVYHQHFNDTAGDSIYVHRESQTADKSIFVKEESNSIDEFEKERKRNNFKQNI